ncbi:hypothetical protein ACFE04_007853 [Oxalis oulophora]
MENPNTLLLTVSDLIHNARAVTASSSSSNHHHHSSSPPPTPLKSNPNKTQTLTPLNYSAILIGTLTLPSLSLNCPHNNCLQFLDNNNNASSICCDVIDFHVGLIGKIIHVIAWNFIPIKNGLAFLEIIKWKLVSSQGNNSNILKQCSNVYSIPLTNTTDHSSGKSSSSVYGAFESISPVTVVPCSSKSRKDHNLRGFLLRVMTCECEFCGSRMIGVDNDCDRLHLFNKPVFVYFCGSAWCWHPVIVKLIGNVVGLSGLKKKVVFIGKQDSELMFVTTDNTVLHVPRVLRKWLPPSIAFLKGQGECASYTGIVRGVYMQGMVVELERDVWLLLTDQLVIAPHSLRVGAVISVRNVHFVNPKFSWTKMLILGACFKTSISVKSFSPLETRSNVASQSKSLLSKFIESLPFSARMWALLVVSSFRRKFLGILSEKEILGSKHKEGLAQVYASSCLSSSVFLARHGVFAELCKHGSCCYGTEPSYGNLNLVLPISSFLCNCETILVRSLLSANVCHTKRFTSLSSRGMHSEYSSRRIFSSEDIGVVLLGNLKICSSSGRLQLVDATGSIDVIVPKLPSTWNPNSIYEVFDYSIVMESTPEIVNHLELLDSEMLSCRTMLLSVPPARKSNIIAYASLQLSNATCKNTSFYPRYLKYDLEEMWMGEFHLIQVTHKYPAAEKFQDNPAISRQSSKFVEAVILPWDLTLTDKDVATNPNEQMVYQLNNRSHVSHKRRKTNHTSAWAVCSGSPSKLGGASSEKQTDGSHEIHCSASIRSANNQCMVASGLLRGKADIDCRGDAARMLLEFDSTSFSKYEFLQIGAYYIAKHHAYDSFCNLKDSAFTSGFKFLFSSSAHLWNLSFSTNDVNLTLSSNYSQSTSSDICLHVPPNVLDLLSVTSEKLDESLIRPAFPLEETSSISQCIWPRMSMSNTNCIFPEGNLISLHGGIVAVHGLQSNCERFSDSHFKFFPEVARNSCMHVLVENKIVKILDSIGKQAYPTGFGPGIHATFHRILELGGANGFMLTPVSFIVINSISVIDESSRENCPILCSASTEPKTSSSKNVSSGLISQLICCLDCNPIRFHCRVVTLHVLVLEKIKNSHDLLPGIQKPHLVDIPLAGCQNGLYLPVDLLNRLRLLPNPIEMFGLVSHR